jgi:protease-4
MIPEIADDTVLVVDLNGYIVEQYTGGYQSEIESRFGERGEDLLRDVKEVIDTASGDDRIKSMFLDLSGFKGGGFSKLQEIGRSLEKFSESGKQIICFGEVLKNGSYFLASYADEIVLDPFGEVRLRGFSSYRSYYKKGLDKFSINVNVFRSGEFKSAVDPYLLDRMSDNDRTALSSLYKPIWKIYTDEVSSRRGMGKDKLLEYVNSYHKILEKVNGDNAEAAHSLNIVDSLGDYDYAKDMFEEINETGWREYIKAARKERTVSDENIAVVVASGVIMDGDFSPGKIGSESFERIFKEIKEDESVKAVVFRIDSGGGSASASEKIRRSVLKLKETGIPIVVSMSSAAASGGYWIASPADTIISYPVTITGSIGVFAVLPDFSDFLEKYPGITVDGYSSALSPESYRPDMPLDEGEKRIIQLGVDNTYSRFLDIVSEGRDIGKEEVRKIAGGRVWSGIAAVENNLVDRTGYFDDALDEAASLAGLTQYSIKYFEPEEDWKLMAARQLSVFFSRLKLPESLLIKGLFARLSGGAAQVSSAIDQFEPGKVYSWSDEPAADF